MTSQIAHSYLRRIASPSSTALAVEHSSRGATAPSCKGSAMSTVRRVVTALAVVTGLISASAGPASAGLNLANHCPPPTTHG
jgi:hypothetical protein